MVVEGNKLIIMSPNTNLRATWETQFQRGNSSDDAGMLIPEVFQNEKFDD